MQLKKNCNSQTVFCLDEVVVLVLAEIRVNFLCSSWYGAFFWICNENRGNNTLMIHYMLLSSAYIKLRTFLLLMLSTGGTQEAGRRHSKDS